MGLKKNSGLGLKNRIMLRRDGFREPDNTKKIGFSISNKMNAYVPSRIERTVRFGVHRLGLRGVPFNHIMV